MSLEDFFSNILVNISSAAIIWGFVHFINVKTKYSIIIIEKKRWESLKKIAPSLTGALNAKDLHN